jgi:hypothetical protein
VSVFDCLKEWASLKRKQLRLPSSSQAPPDRLGLRLAVTIARA